MEIFWIYSNLFIASRSFAILFIIIIKRTREFCVHACSNEYETMWSNASLSADLPLLSKQRIFDAIDKADRHDVCIA